MRADSPPPYVGPPPVPKMPAGLVDLVEGLTREVLKNNPKNVYEFCAKHFEKLLESRDGQSLKKPMLTLEQRIHEAQEKVRQKAKERREKYDREMNARSHKEEQPTTEIQKNNENNTSKADSDISIINAMPPVHHEEGLKPDSEVEIAHKAFYITDEEKTYKIVNVETKKEEVSAETLTVKDSNTDLSKGKDISKEDPVNEETALPKVTNDDKAVENVKLNDTSVHLVPANNDVAISPSKLDGQDLASNGGKDSATTHSENNITHETKSIPITQNLKKENLVNSDNIDKKDEENKLSSSTNAASEINDESNSTMPLNNASTERFDESQCESDLLSTTETSTLKEDTKFNKDEAPFTDNKPDNHKQANNDENVKKEENNEPASETNLYVPKADSTTKVESLTENRDDLLNTNVIEKDTSTDNLTVPNETMPIIKDTSNILSNINSDVINDINLNSTLEHKTNKETNVTPNGNDAVVVPESVGTHKNMTAVNKEIDDGFDKTVMVEKNGNETPSVEPEISMTSNLNANVTEHTKENIKEVVSNEGKETPIQEKEHTDNPSVHVLENSNMVNKDTSSLVGSDLSKIEEDTTGESQNDHNNMDLETAAVTIQKVFRTFLFKSRNSTFDDGTNDFKSRNSTFDDGTSLDDDSENIKKEEYYAVVNLNKERRPLGISRMDTVLQTVNEEKSLSLSTDDSSTLSSAATTIQAHVRGFLVRNRLNSNKTVSTNSVNSNEFLEAEPDTEQQKNKTVLNIHIVPEEGNYLSRDESIITSMELSLDGSPPSSVNLHPLSHDVSERRKLLKREDAIQSISPPSNNSGKLSEESVKELFINDETVDGNVVIETDKISEEALEPNNDSGVDSEAVSISSTATATTIINVTDLTMSQEHKRSKSLQNMDHDEADVVTPYVRSPRSDSGDYDSSSKLEHSGEFHDALLPTRVTRNDTTVVREFKNVLVYFIIWNR